MAVIGTISRALLERATAYYVGGVSRTVLDAQGNLVIGDTPPAAPTIISTITDRVYTVGSGPYTIDLGDKFSGAGAFIVTPTSPNLSLSGDTLTITPSVTMPLTEITVIGRNGGGDSPALTFDLTVNAVAPTLTTPLPDQALNLGGANVTLALDGYFANASGYSVSPAGQGATISGRTLVLSAAAARSVSVTVTATNTTGQTASDSFLFAVAQQTQAPAVQSVPTITGNTAVGSILTRTAGTATGIPAPTRATVWLRNGDVLDGQNGNSLDTTGFAADDIITTRDDWANSQGNATGTSLPFTLTAENLEPLTGTLSPNPPAAGQPFEVDFNVAPDSTSSNLTGTGTRRTGTAPASGNLVISATKAGYSAFDLTVGTVPAIAPTLTGGTLQLDGGDVALIPPEISGGYPAPTLALTYLTRNGSDVTGELNVDGDRIEDAPAGTYAVRWTASNGVSPAAQADDDLTVAAPAINAVSVPTGSRTYAGQTPAAIAGISTATDTANYSTTTGTISSAQLQVNEENATTSTPLATSDEVSVLVTTSTGLTRRFPLSVTEYAYEIIDQGPAGFDLRINDLMPGSLNQTIGALGDTTTTTLDALNVGPVSHIAPVIALKGEVFEDTNADRWLTERSAGTVSYARQWLRNGVAIAGATGPTYTRGTADGGTTTTLRKTATNGNGTGASAISNSIANAGLVNVVSVTNIGLLSSLKVSESGDPHAMGSVTIPASGAGRVVVRALVYSSATVIPDIASVTIGGVAVPFTARGEARVSGLIASIPRVSLSPGAQPVIVTLVGGDTSIACRVSVDWLEGADTPSAAMSAVFANSVPSSIVLDTNASANGAILGLLGERQTGTPGAIAWTGLTEENRLTQEFGSDRYTTEFASILTAATEAPRAISVTGLAGVRGVGMTQFFPAGA